jgi:PEP-CTERM motif-containing protein
MGEHHMSIVRGLWGIVSCKNLTVMLALPVLAMLAFIQQATATTICSSSVVHILFDDGATQCTDATGTATSAFSKGSSATLSGDASLGIRIGAFSGFAQIGGATLIPNSTTYFADAIGLTNDAVTPTGPVAVGTHLTLVVPFHLTGAFRASFSAPVGFGVALPQVLNEFSFTCAGFIGSTGGDCGHGKISSTVPDMSDPQAVDQTFLMTIPLAIGLETDVQMMVKILAQMTLPSGVGLTCDPSTVVGCHEGGDAIFDLSHTGKFEPAMIVDVTGHRVFDVTLSSASGFDYLNPAGSGPGGGGTTVPEPASLALLVFGVAALGLARRKLA